MVGEWLPEACGPDRVPVTFCVMTTVSRYTQAVSGIGVVGGMLTGEYRIGPSPWRRLGPLALNKVQQLVGGYVVAVEADGSKPFFLRGHTRQEVVDIAARISAAVDSFGASALSEWMPS